MIRHYFLSSLRFFTRQRLHNALNLIGVVVGFGAIYLISLYLSFQFSFDSFHHDADRIYRIVHHVGQPDGGIRKVAAVAPRIGPELVQSFPEVEDATRLVIGGRLTVGNDPQRWGYEQINLVDANFFDFFDFTLDEGGPAPLSQPGTPVILERTVADAYLGTGPAVGKTLTTSLFDVEVTAVVRPFPDNSHIRLGTVYPISTWAANFEGFRNTEATNWTSNSFVTYVKLRPGASAEALALKMADWVSAHYPTDNPFTGKFELQPLKDIHFYSSDIEGGMNRNAGNKTYMQVFLLVGLLVLLIVGFNVANLSAAMLTRRMQEMGIRTTLGARQMQLLGHFVVESALMTTAGVVFALILLQSVLAVVNSFLETTLSFSSMPVSSWLIVTAVLFAVSMVSLIYPLLLVAKIRPGHILQRHAASGVHTSTLRNVMVGLQFVIAIFMIGSTIVIYRQVNYMRDNDPGFSQAGLITIDINSGAMRSQAEHVKAAYLALPEVKSVSVSSRVPGEWKLFPMVEMRSPSGETVPDVIYLGADENFIDTYQVTLLSGRNFLPGVADSGSVLINRTAAELLGLSDPIGASIRIPSVTYGGNRTEIGEPVQARIAGVVDDFQFESFRETLRPMILANWYNPIMAIDYYTLRLETRSFSETVSKLAEITRQYDPNNPMEYHVLSDQLSRFFDDDNNMARLFIMLTFVMVVIACLGLFAVASFALQQRTKEVVIRKVLGASQATLFQMLLRDYVWICAVASVIACPLIYWATQQWLVQFAIKADFAYWTLPAACFIGLVFALGTVFYLTKKIAESNPVEHLRSN